MKLSKMITPQYLLWDLNAVERDPILLEIAEFLKAGERISNSREIYEKLRAREDILSTGIGNGVAIPHCKTDQIKEVLVVLARSEKGVDFKSVDDEKVHILFTVLSPPDQPNPHLQVLARISKLLRNPGTINRFLHAHDPQQLCSFIEEEEKKIP